MKITEKYKHYTSFENAFLYHVKVNCIYMISNHARVSRFQSYHICQCFCDSQRIYLLAFAAANDPDTEWTFPLP